MQVEFTGTVGPMGAPGPDGHPQALDGELTYWVAFDTPQRDSGGDGRCRRSRIRGRLLRSEPGAPTHG